MAQQESSTSATFGAVGFVFLVLGLGLLFTSAGAGLPFLVLGATFLVIAFSRPRS